MDAARHILTKTSYFSLISGYKDIFKNPTTGKYIDGTTFEDIYHLYRFDHELRSIFLKYMLLSLTVGKRKNRCIPCIYWATAIFGLATKYSNLFPPFTLFLNIFHFTFRYKLIIRSKAASIMKRICYRLSFVCWDKALFLNLNKIHCF